MWIFPHPLSPTTPSCSAPLQTEADTVHRMQHPLRGFKIFFQFLHFEQYIHQKSSSFPSQHLKHFTKWPSSTSRTPGSDCKHFSMLKSHLCAKLQPGGRLDGSGIRPFIGLSRSTFSLRFGREANRPLVYGCRISVYLPQRPAFYNLPHT